MKAVGAICIYAGGCSSLLIRKEISRVWEIFAVFHLENQHNGNLKKNFNNGAELSQTLRGKAHFWHKRKGNVVCELHGHPPRCESSIPIFLNLDASYCTPVASVETR